MWNTDNIITSNISGCCNPRHNSHRFVTSTTCRQIDVKILTTLSHLFHDMLLMWPTIIIHRFATSTTCRQIDVIILKILSHLTFQDVATHVTITSFCDINNKSLDVNIDKIITSNIDDRMLQLTSQSHRFVTSTTRHQIDVKYWQHYQI